MVRAILNALFINLALSYFVLIQKNPEGFSTPRVTWLFFALIAVPFLFVPPVFSGDLYEYLIRGRIFALYGQSPYLRFPESFPQDILFSYSSWPHAPDAYGPVFLYIKAIPAFLFQNSVTGMIFGMKLIIFLFMVVAVFFFTRIARLLKKENTGRLVCVFAFCPILLVSTLVDGLNDIVMTSLTLAAVYFLFKKRVTVAYLLWTCAFLVKVTAILTLPFLVVATLKMSYEKNSGFSWKLALGQTFFVAGLIVAAYAPVWAGPQTFGALTNLGQRFYNNTIPYAAQKALSFLGVRLPDADARVAFLVFFLLVYSGLLYRYWRKKEDTLGGLVFSLASAHLAFYFCLSTPFIYNYLIWGLPWLILCEWPLQSLLITLYSFTGIFSYFKRINYLMILAAIVYFLALASQKFGRRFFRSGRGAV